MNPNVEYTNLDVAFYFFNERLFENKLPKVLLTLRNHNGRAKGYFRWKAFSSRLHQDVMTDEISLCMETFSTRTDKEILSTLVHEQVHLRQFHHGSPGRRGYHNQEWASMMLEVGLTPTDTGEVGGKMTGERVTHIINPDGRFDVAATELLATGWKLGWQEYSPPVLAALLPGGMLAVPATKQTRRKFTCPKCALNAWAKHTAAISCTDCNLPMM